MSLTWPPEEALACVWRPAHDGVIVGLGNIEIMKTSLTAAPVRLYHCTKPPRLHELVFDRCGVIKVAVALVAGNGVRQKEMSRD